LDVPNRDKDTPNIHIDKKEMLEKEFPEIRGSCSEDYRKGRLARCWQHNLEPRDLTSPYPSKVFLYLPQEVGRVGFYCLRAGDIGKRGQPKKLLENTKLFYFL